MNTSTTASDAPGGGRSRQRDAARTRAQLLAVARRRFAEDGYAATTVRHVADEVGVNMALIGRYFGSKEGLFEACLEAAVDDLRSTTGRPATGVAGLARRLAEQVTSPLPPGYRRGAAAQAPTTEPQAEEPTPAAPRGDVLLLLLRSSGDARADDLRRGLLHRFSAAILTALGSEDPAVDTSADTSADPASTPDDRAAALARAQLVVAAAMGVAVLRSSLELEPLHSASAEDLEPVFAQMLAAVPGPAVRGSTARGSTVRASTHQA